MAAIMVGATAMAQDQSADNTEMVKKRTEAVAEKYGLNEEQTQKLLELNTKYANLMGPGPGQGGGRPGGGPGGDGGSGRPEGGPGGPGGGDSVRAERPQMSEEQRKEMQEKMEAYDKELQEIMTEDQYNSYKSDMQNRRGGGPRNSGRN